MALGRIEFMKRMLPLVMVMVTSAGCRDAATESDSPSPAIAKKVDAPAAPKVVQTLPSEEPEPPPEPTFRLVMGEATVEVEASKRAPRTRTTRGARSTTQKSATTRARRASIMGTIRANWGDVERCYGDAVSKNASLAGKITFQWTLGASGVPSAVSVVRDTLADKAVGECIRSRARDWRFPAPKGGVGVVKYTYDLRTK
jgi:hypothetical protein